MFSIILVGGQGKALPTYFLIHDKLWSLRFRVSTGSDMPSENVSPST